MSSWIHIHLRLRPEWLLLVAADRLWERAILGLVGLRSLLLQSVVRAHLLSVQPEGTAKSNNLLGKLARESLRSSEINSRLYLPVPRFSVRVFNWVKNGYKINNVFIWTAVALTCLSVLFLECRIHPRKLLYRERWKK